MTESAADRGLIGDRYRIEAELGHGGMARVYRVVDTRSGAHLALKQLVTFTDHPATEHAMFEHEYHTLVQLAHPHVVRVFDYGVDPTGPFYTMEVLEGRNARDSMREAPLEVRAVCGLLRDLSSALALIHSRRLAHRDLSPRNVWCTPDGRAKLIDFGTLAPLGVQTGIAGTPPFVPPEAVHLQPLDARSDVYALGALAYYMLVRRHAYPARRVRDLRKLWQRRPALPSALRAEIPAALSELVMQMLSLDPRGRPMSAGEVYDRLTAIGGLPVEHDRRVAQAFLSTPTLIGRERQRVRVRGHLLDLVRGRGGTLPIVAPAGLGRTRMLASVVLDAKLMGATAVTVAAGATAGEPLSAAVAAAEQLLEALPAVPELPEEPRAALAQLSPALRRAFAAAPREEGLARDRRRRAGQALVALIEAAAEQQPILIAVDDVHRIDDASLAVFAQLSLLAERRRLLLAASCDAAALSKAAPALAQLAQPELALTLDPLSEQETHALLAAVFGEVPGLEPVTRFLHELAEGNPRACMSYAQYLVDGGFARLEAGSWRLPERVREHGLPASLSALFDARVAALSDDARALALGFALGRDATRAAWQPENHVHVADFPKLLDAPSGSDASARAFAALDELVRVGLVEQHGAHYALAQTAVVDALLRASDDGARLRTHARLAEVFGQPSYPDPFLAVRHLQAAQQFDASRAALLQLAADSARGTVNWDWSSIRVSVASACAARQLEHLARHGGSRRDRIVLRRLLMVSCSVADWRIARVGDQQVPELCAAVGLGHLAELDPMLSPEARLAACMERARGERDAASDEARGPTPEEAGRELGACTLPLSGAFVNSHDLARAEALVRSVAPLRPFSPLHTLLADLTDLAVDRIRGRAVGDRLVEAAQRLHASQGLPDVLRMGGVGVYLHVQALEDARRGKKRALELMDLMAMSAGDALFIVVHGRWLGRAYRGDATAARAARQQVEIVTEDDVWRRKAYLFVEAELHALTGDLASLAHTSDAIGELAAIFEGWAPWHAYCRGEIRRLRGELDAARAELQTALAAAEPGVHRAYGVVAPACADLLLALGEPAHAAREAATIAERVRTLGLDPGALVAAERVGALAASALGQHAQARTLVASALSHARELGYDGLPLAQLHLAEARVALAAGEREASDAALASVRLLIEHAEAPALFGAYERLRAEAGYDGAEDEARAAAARIARPAPGAEPPLASEVIASAETYAGSSRATLISRRPRRPAAPLDSAPTPAARAKAALALLLEQSGASAGHLLLFGVGGIGVAATLGSATAGEELLGWAQRYVDQELGAARRGTSTTPSLIAPSTPPPLPFTPSDDGFEPHLLSDLANGASLFVGLVLLVAPTSPGALTRGDLVQTLSRALLEAGDCVPLALEL